MRSANEARALAKRILGFTSRANQAEVSVTFDDTAYARFARNYVVQNLASAQGHARITVVSGKHVGTVSTSDLGDDALRAAVARAFDIAGRVPANAEFVSLATPGRIPAPVTSVFAATRDTSPDDRVDKLLPVFARMERSRLSSSGFTTTQTNARAVVNSLGVDATHTATYAGLEIKAIAPHTSGFAEHFARDYATVDAAERAERAAGKATVAGEPQDFAPGTYSVLLEPPAFVDCLNNVLEGMNVGAVLEEKSSWLIGRTGKAVLSPNFTLRDDWSDPLPRELALRRGRYADAEADARRGRRPAVLRQLDVPREQAARAQHRTRRLSDQRDRHARFQIARGTHRVDRARHPDFPHLVYAARRSAGMHDHRAYARRCVSHRKR